MPLELGSQILSLLPLVVILAAEVVLGHLLQVQQLFSSLQPPLPK